MSQPSLNDLYAALLAANQNEILLANQIDQLYGTSLTGSVQVMPADPPALPAGGDSVDVYNAAGYTNPDADGCVKILSVENFRTQYKNAPQASVRNLAVGLPTRWFVQDVLDSLAAAGTPVTDPVFFQVQANCAKARMFLSIEMAPRTQYYIPAVHASASSTGLWKEGDVFTPTVGAFSGDFVIAGKVVWTGVRVKDVPVVLAAQLARALKNPTINNQ